jgi:hypothetical protein
VRPVVHRLWLVTASAAASAFLARESAEGAEATFFRAINLNGPTLRIDGQTWEADSTTNVVIHGNQFENQLVPLKPAIDPARARMIRSSRWGSKVDVELTAVPSGPYQVFAYVWEDNHSEQFDLLLNGTVVQEKFHSGNAGAWRRLGPWSITLSGTNTSLRLAARGPGHGAANLSGIEVWSGTGLLPQPTRPRFATNPTPEQVAFFESRVRPVLAEHCYECHSATATKLKGGLLLDSRAGVVQGGDTGPAITPGDPDASLLIQAVRRSDPNLAMPPKSALPAQAVADLEAWVRMGAPDPRTENTVASARARSAIDWNKAREWWSFKPVAQPSPPTVRNTDWPASPIDHFVLARLEERKLAPAPDADRRALIRRTTFDLTGLPPTPAEVEAFVRDSAPDAFARVVDRLLDSPTYGERWGRHWLDVVRYADSAGDNSDFPIPQMHRYRDWVIGAFNRDLPFDRFIREQLAGDLLPAASETEHFQQVIATGYIANARRFGSRVDDYPQHLTIEDTLDNLGRAFLGLSLNCARCHDHKFDPIPTDDYYALYGIFSSTRYPWPGIELEQRQRDLVPLVPRSELASAEKALREHDTETRRLQKAVQTLKDSLKSIPATEKKSVEDRIKSAESAVRAHAAKAPALPNAYAVAETAAGADAAVQAKGDPAKPGRMVPRRFLQVLGGSQLPEGAKSSGRLELAGWITDPANPLTARVLVNRVWLHHFGRGLVPTPNDFGRQGRPPSHPELLDWLARRFIESGYSIKSLHRLILASRTYQQSTRRSAEAIELDPTNELLGAYPRRRLDAESIRDTLLQLGGSLDTSPAGAHPFPPQSEWKFTQHNPFRAVYESRRRSVYLMTQRIQRHPFLATFDGADPSASTAARLTSTTPVQALFLLNDPLVHEQSTAFATRLQRDASTPTDRIRLAYALAFARQPDAAEESEASRFLERLAANSSPDAERTAWEAFARALFRLNEFVYLD